MTRSYSVPVLNFNFCCKNYSKLYYMAWLVALGGERGAIGSTAYSLSSSCSIRFSISEVLFWRLKSFAFTWHFCNCDAQSAWTLTLHILHLRPCLVCPVGLLLGFHVKSSEKNIYFWDINCWRNFLIVRVDKKGKFKKPLKAMKTAIMRVTRAKTGKCHKLLVAEVF